MVYIKIPFFLSDWHFQESVMLNVDGPSERLSHFLVLLIET